jgi:hypothetical protein
MSLTPIALPPALPSELLDYILVHQVYPTTLVICQPRATFLSSLSNAIKHTPPPPPPDPDTSETLSAEAPQRHPLLIPTLHQVATSRHVNLVFISTVTHLRAYLAVSPGPEPKEAPPKREWDKSGKKGRTVPLLVAYGVVGLHKDTSEWSAQGLGNSLAGLVEAGVRGGRRVVVVEEKRLEDEEEDGAEEEMTDEVAGEERRKVCKVWEERVPMLNGSVRRAGLESEEGGWSGRTVEVGRILARWFKFRKGD